MSEIGRREALGLLAGTAATGLIGCGDEAGVNGREDLGEATQALVLPQLAALLLPGTHAYAQKTVRAGESIDFRISSDTPYRLSVVRLGWDTTGPTRDNVVAAFPDSAAKVQPIRKGSYARVSVGVPATNFPEMSLECWVRPAKVAATDASGAAVALPSSARGWQGLVCQYQYPTTCGVGLFIDASGRPAMYWGDGGAFNAAWLMSSSGASIVDGNWHHLVATFKSGTARLFVDGVQTATFTRPSTVNPGSGPLNVGAYVENSTTGYLLDGDVAMPVIYNKALTTGAGGEIQTRFATRPPVVPAAAGLLACWPLTDERGTFVRDASGQNRSAEIVNGATWMIDGPGYIAPSRASTVIGTGTYNPFNDATRGHALRFSREDLYDCGWAISASYTIPRDLLPGIYVGRIMYGTNFSARYDATFVVRPAPTKPKARVLVLCNTNTWAAYMVPFANAPWAIDGWGTGGAEISLPNAPSFNMYSKHRHRELDAGGNSVYVDTHKPAVQVGVNMPWGAFPYAAYGAPYGHLIRAERPFHVWLEQMGYDFDVAGDIDLDADPTLLAGYQIVAIVGHSEYWSAAAYSTVEGYLNSGGRLMVLSGNTMFWRVSFDPARQIMECRKCPELVGGQTSDYGLTYHSQDWARGGLMREAGHPAWRLTGLESVGYDGTPRGAYFVRQPSHSFFLSPEAISVVVNSALAVGGVGHEYDITRESLQGSINIPALPGSPPITLLDAPPFPEGGKDSAVHSGTYFDYAAGAATPREQPPGKPAVASEVIDWQRGPGGRVFSAGAIGVVSKLREDLQLGSLVRNVMHQFGVAHRRDFFVRTTDGKIRGKRWLGTTWLPTTNGLGWDDLGGALVTSPTVAQSAPNCIVIMGLDSAGALRYRERRGDSWLAWTTQAGVTLTGRVAAVSWARDRLNIFGRGTDGHIYCLYRDGSSSSWSTWQDMGGAMSGPPAAALYNGNPIMAAIGTNGNLMYRWSDGTNWFPSNGWLDMGGGGLTGTPVLTTWGGNRVSIFAVDTNGNVLTKEWDGANWSGWSVVGSATTGTPAVAVRGGDKLTLVAVGRQGDMLAKSRSGLNALWDAGWSFIGSGFVGSPSALNFRGESVSVTGVTASGRFSLCEWDGLSWGAWANLSGDLAGNFNGTPQSLSWFGS